MTGDGTDAALDAAREALVAACRHLAARGLSPGGSGNLSVRVGDALLITPTGSSLSRVTARDLAVAPVDPGAASAAGPGAPVERSAGPVPSKELPLWPALSPMAAKPMPVT